MGNSRGWRGLFETPGLLEQVEYERLQLMQSEQRIAIVAKVFRAATIRRPDTKAAWLSENVELLRLLGGPTLAWQQAIALPERAEKIQFLLRFKGIGDKYARNIWMDVYDDAFRDAIAVDERIKSVTRALGREFRTYADHEAFYQEVAADAGLEPWELDRLLYQFKAHFLAAISGAG
jgi:hypothetical protein